MQTRGGCRPPPRGQPVCLRTRPTRRERSPPGGPELGRRAAGHALPPRSLASRRRGGRPPLSFPPRGGSARGEVLRPGAPCRRLRAAPSGADCGARWWERAGEGRPGRGWLAGQEGNSGGRTRRERTTRPPAPPAGLTCPAPRCAAAPPRGERETASIRPEASGGYPPNLSISLSGGKEINRDLPSSGERTGASPALNRGLA